MNIVKFNMETLERAATDESDIPCNNETIHFKGRKPKQSDAKKFICPYTGAHFDYDVMFCLLLKTKDAQERQETTS